MRLMTPLARVRGHGSAKEGAHHWWVQRLTAIALIPLSIWFLSSLFSMLPADYDTVVLWFNSPIVTLLMLSMVAALFYHAKLGMQTIIEDYVNSTSAQFTMLILNKLIFLACGVISVLAILTLHITNVGY